MTNQEQLFIVKQASGLVARGLGFVGRNLSRGARAVAGSRGATGYTRHALSPSSTARQSLWGAKGLKGLSRPALTQLSKRPAFHSVGQAGIPSTSMQQAGNNMVATPLANLLKVLGAGGAGGAIGYGMKKGLDADDELGPPYNYNGNPNKPRPNKNTGVRLKKQTQ